MRKILGATQTEFPTHIDCDCGLLLLAMAETFELDPLLCCSVVVHIIIVV